MLLGQPAPRHVTADRPRRHDRTRLGAHTLFLPCDPAPALCRHPAVFVARLIRRARQLLHRTPPVSHVVRMNQVSWFASCPAVRGRTEFAGECGIHRQHFPVRSSQQRELRALAPRRQPLRMDARPGVRIQRNQTQARAASGALQRVHPHGRRHVGRPSNVLPCAPDHFSRRESQQRQRTRRRRPHASGAVKHQQRILTFGDDGRSHNLR